MQVLDEFHYSAPPAQVAAMLADEAFLHAKCERMHAEQHEVTVEGRATDRFTVTVVRTASTDRFPDLARSFVGRMVHVRQVDRWLRPDEEGQRDGTVTLSVTGLPVGFEGRYEMRTWGEGTRILLRGVLEAAIPFFGHRLEQLVEPAVRAAIRREQETGTTWLAAR